jgi:hypothetical protein
MGQSRTAMLQSSFSIYMHATSILCDDCIPSSVVFWPGLPPMPYLIELPRKRSAKIKVESLEEVLLFLPSKRDCLPSPRLSEWSYYSASGYTQEYGLTRLCPVQN